jgi:hypothetical protein
MPSQDLNRIQYTSFHPFQVLKALLRAKEEAQNARIRFPMGILYPASAISPYCESSIQNWPANLKMDYLIHETVTADFLGVRTAQIHD